MKRFAIPLLLIAASVAVYLPTLKFDFVIDDARQIEMMESRFTWSQIPSYFTTDVWSYVDSQKTNYYRPIFVLWMMLTYQASGLSHPLWHASAILTNALATLLLYFLALRLTGNQITAGIAALIYAVHPVHLESVAWVSGATEPLCAVLFFATLLLYIAARHEPEQQRARWWRWGSVAAFAFAVLAKETAVVLPLLIFAYAWLFPETSEACHEPLGKRARVAFFASFPYLQTLIVYFGMRVLALGNFSPHVGQWSFKSMIATLPVTAWFYIRELLWPFHLSIFPPVEKVRHLGFGNFVGPSLAVAAAIAALVWISLRSRRAAFCSMILVLSLAPVFDLRAFSPDDFVHDRYLYIPSAGLCILLAMGLAKWTRSIPVQAAVVAPVVLGLAYFTIQESRPWVDYMTLAQHALATAPDNWPAQELMATALLLIERDGEALPLLDRGLATHPRDLVLRMRVATGNFRIGNFPKAESEFKTVLQYQPQSPQAHLLLGMTEQGMGNLDQAEAEMREAVRERPRTSVQFRGYRLSLAELLEGKGDLQGALEQYNLELEEYPDESAALDHAMALKKKIDISN
jgi:protein O-mannosyl-transferase